MIDFMKAKKRKASLAELLAQWMAALELFTDRKTPIAARPVGNHFATRDDVMHYGITAARSFTAPTQAGINSRRPFDEVSPRPQDLEQLSSVGHGRVKEVVNGVVVYEAWYRHGKLHGEHGAALIRRNPKTGVVTSESWWRNGKQNRFDGKPAEIRRDALTGQMIGEAWYIEGVEISPSVRAIVGTVERYAKRLGLA